MKKIVFLLLSIIVVTLSIGVFTACTKEMYTVTYDHGYDGKVEKIQIEKGQGLPDVPEPKRHSYIFSEWIMEGNPDFDYKTYKVTSDITLKATWENALNVKVIINEQEEDYEEVQVKPGETLPQDLGKTLRYDKDNYNLLGFNLYTADKELIPFDLSTPIVEDIELVAELMSKGLKIEVYNDHCVVVDYDKKAHKHRVIIPTYYEGKKVTSIEKNIGNQGVFEECKNLAGITLPRYLEYIDAYTFRQCSDLGAIWLPYTINEIGKYAFSALNSDSTLTAIFFEDNSKLNRLPEGLFQEQRNLKRVVLPEGLKTIDKWVFQYCTTLQQVNLPKSLVSISAFAFQNCISIKELFIYENVTMIEGDAFKDCDPEMKLYTKANQVNSYNINWNVSNTGFVYSTTYNFRSVKLDLQGGYISNFNPNNKNAVLGSYYDNTRITYIPTLKDSDKKFAYYYIIVNGREVKVSDNKALLTNLEYVQDGMTLYAKYI